MQPIDGEGHQNCMKAGIDRRSLPTQDEIMRTFLILSMFTASLAYADWEQNRQERNLELDARNIDAIEVESRAGSLEITGQANSDRISVVAIIQVSDKDADKIDKMIADDLVFSLEKEGNKAVLKGFFDENNWGWSESPSVHLEVSIPRRFALSIEDSSGSIKVNSVSGDVDVDDSSGSIKMADVGGSIDISDSSGSIKVTGVGNSISIEDGSGSIDVRDVGGSVTIDDGSGSITVKNVERDLIILSDGSGSVSYTNIQGQVQQD